MSELWMEKYAALEGGPANHRGHAFATETLREIERFLPKQIERSAEFADGDMRQFHYIGVAPSA